MKRIILILIMVPISFKMLAPFGYISYLDWNKMQRLLIIEEQKIALMIGIQCKETWHDSLSCKKGSPYKKVNKIGALGAFQFMPGTLRYLGYKGSFKSFLSNKNLQKEYMLKLIEYNLSILKVESKAYKITPVHFIGKKKSSVEITLSGLIAASHLAGVGGVQKFLATGYNAKDMNNTSVKAYLNIFKSYKLEYIL